MCGKTTAAGAGQSFAYEIKGNSAVIRRCFSRDTKAEIPEQIEGYPVTEIAPYAFSAHMDGQELAENIRMGKVQLYLSELMRMEVQEEYDRLPVLCGNLVEAVVLPDSVRHVGRYCFYNCAQLHLLEFSGGLEDWGSGVFTGCHQIRKLRVHTEREQKLYLKDMLDELMEELEVELTSEAGEGAPQDMPFREVYARLWFPEFYEEGVENTPARILETHVHGSGMRYRNCFQGRRFDFAQYDVLFPHAIAQESGEFLTQMVMGRLRYPYELSQKAEKQYEAYAKEHAYELAYYLIKGYDMEGVRWLLSLTEGDNEGLLDRMTELASQEQFAEAMSYLMNYRRMHKKVSRRRLEL